MTIPRIEGFDITTWVRETSTGVILRAHQRSLDRPVLLHLLKAGVDSSLRSAFERNARLVARIDALLESFAAETGAAPAEVADAAAPSATPLRFWSAPRAISWFTTWTLSPTST